MRIPKFLPNVTILAIFRSGFILPILGAMKWYPLVVQTCISPMPSEVQDLFWHGESEGFAAWDTCTYESKPLPFGKAM